MPSNLKPAPLLPGCKSQVLKLFWVLGIGGPLSNRWRATNAYPKQFEHLNYKSHSYLISSFILNKEIPCLNLSNVILHISVPEISSLVNHWPVLQCRYLLMNSPSDLVIQMNIITVVEPTIHFKTLISYSLPWLSSNSDSDMLHDRLESAEN